MSFSLRRFLFGRPLPTWRAVHERLPKVLALPVFASDALSSVAYATQEILIVLMAAGAAAFRHSIPITIAVIVLLWMVITSYRRTIFAYPRGGGTYIVSKDNLGVLPGLIAAAAILIDYTLTVAVSISAGVAAIVSAVPSLGVHSVEISVAFIALIALGNLRGARESGMLFAVPTYVFIVSFLIMIGVGVTRALTGTLPAGHAHHVEAITGLSTVLILRAFSSGCTAMTGTEAVADGVAAFKAPEARNAATTLVIMGAVLSTMFFGISWLGHHLAVVPTEHVGGETVVSMIARGIFGREWFYYLIQISTMAILVLAANTSFADFPRLSYFLARDRFMPRQFANIGDRLVFSNGIVVLSLLAAVLVVAFHANVNRLIPLYAVGVFLAFTLSQFGMVVHTRQLKQRGWGVSLVGGVATGIVTLIQAYTKFWHGAGLVVICIPILVFIFLRINRHYRQVAEQLRLPLGEDIELPEMRNTVIILVSGIHKGILPALQYAKSLSHDCRGVYIETEQESTPLLEERWEKYGQGIPLVVLESPYRSIIQPLKKYLEEVKEERTRHMVTVVIPEFVPAKFWHQILHGQSGLALKYALMFRRDIVVANIRYYLEK